MTIVKGMFHALGTNNRTICGLPHADQRNTTDLPELIDCDNCRKEMRMLSRKEQEALSKEINDTLTSVTNTLTAKTRVSVETLGSFNLEKWVKNYLMDSLSKELLKNITPTRKDLRPSCQVEYSAQCRILNKEISVEHLAELITRISEKFITQQRRFL